MISKVEENLGDIDIKNFTVSPLNHIACNSIRISEFERFVDGIRETASKHLHTLVLERADLKVSKLHNGQVSLQD